MTTAIELENVSKKYGGTEVLHSVTFACPEGSIVAFVGPNGAGKSTTMRIICRLSAPTAGRVLINGQPASAVGDPGALIGSVLDPSAHHPGRTVLHTVMIPALMMGISKVRVHELVDQLGLASVRRRRFKALSLGMKQRVSLAIALLANPRILVLDEPMNGLDVDGIEWIRNVLRRFADEGGTVLVSSHLLNELQMFADRLVIISQGEVKADEALAGREKTGALVHPAQPEELERLLQTHQIAFIKKDADYTVEATKDQIARLAFDARVLLLELTTATRGVSIERTYHELTTGDFAMRSEQ